MRTYALAKEVMWC